MSAIPFRTGVVIPAGGKGVRAGKGKTAKQFQKIGDKPLFLYGLEAFHRLEEIEQIVLVFPEYAIVEWEKILLQWPKVKLALGGSHRWESVKNGFYALDPGIQYILVHDAARPFVSKDILQSCMNAFARGRNFVVAKPATDTIKQVSGQRIHQTLDRNKLIQVQTPQGFSREVLEEVYASSRWKNFIPENVQPTDESWMVEVCGFPMDWISGDDMNRKITHEEDLVWAEWMAGRIQREEVNLYD